MALNIYNNIPGVKPNGRQAATIQNLAGLINPNALPITYKKVGNTSDRSKTDTSDANLQGWLDDYLDRGKEVFEKSGADALQKFNKEKSESYFNKGPFTTGQRAQAREYANSQFNSMIAGENPAEVAQAVETKPAPTPEETKAKEAKEAAAKEEIKKQSLKAVPEVPKEITDTIDKTAVDIGVREPKPAEIKESLKPAPEKDNIEKLKEAEVKHDPLVEQVIDSTSNSTSLAGPAALEYREKEAELIKLQKEFLAAGDDKILANEKAGEILNLINDMNSLQSTIRQDINNAERLYRDYDFLETDVYKKEYPKDLIWEWIKDSKKLRNLRDNARTPEEQQKAKEALKDLHFGNTHFLLNALATGLAGIYVPGKYGRDGVQEKSLWRQKQEQELKAGIDRWEKAKDEKFQATRDYIKQVYGEDSRLISQFNDIIMNEANQRMMNNLSNEQQVNAIYMIDKIGNALQNVDRENLIRNILYTTNTGDFDPLFHLLAATPTEDLKVLEDSLKDVTGDIKQNGIISTLGTLVQDILAGRSRPRASWEN